MHRKGKSLAISYDMVLIKVFSLNKMAYRNQALIDKGGISLKPQKGIFICIFKQISGEIYSVENEFKHGMKHILIRLQTFQIEV